MSFSFVDSGIECFVSLVILHLLLSFGQLSVLLFVRSTTYSWQMTDVPPHYDPQSYPRFAVTVDMVVFTIRSGELYIALVQRGEEPFLGKWALPGGFVRSDENLDQAAARELEEETGLRQSRAWYLEQLGSYGTPDRDPRMRVVTVAYLAVCPRLPRLRSGGDAARAELRPVHTVDWTSLAFDHARIAQDALERIRSRVEYTTLATWFIDPVFTVSELREVYEIVWSTHLDKGNFRRNFGKSHRFQPRGQRRGTGRPASLWSVGESDAKDQGVMLLDRPLASRNVGI